MLIIDRKNPTKGFEVLKRVVDRLNDCFDSRELYHHSTANGEICELQYLYDGRREGFRIYYMGQCIWSEPLDDFYDDTFVTIDFENEDEIYETAYQKIIGEYMWMLTILKHSEAEITDKHSVFEEK
jgi:hypothetical protein